MNDAINAGITPAELERLNAGETVMLVVTGELNDQTFEFTEFAEPIYVYLRPQGPLTIDVLDLKVRAYNILKRHNIDTLEDLTALGWADLADFRDMGLRSITEIEDKLAQRGLALATPLPEHLRWEKWN